MAKTCDWIVATADSKTRRAISPKIKNDNKNVDKEFPVFAIKVDNKCPAIILAVDRRAKVPVELHC